MRWGSRARVGSIGPAPAFPRLWVGASTCAVCALGRPSLADKPSRKHASALQEIIDLHGLARVVAAVGVAYEQHGGRHPRHGEGRGVMGSGTCERHGRDTERLAAQSVNLAYEFGVRRGHLGGRARSKLEAHAALVSDAFRKLEELRLKLGEMSRA